LPPSPSPLFVGPGSLRTNNPDVLYSQAGFYAAVGRVPQVLCDRGGMFVTELLILGLVPALET
jgi:hypothetical protein